MWNLNFEIPEQKNQVSSGRDLRPKVIERWLEDLPRANVGVMAKQIYTLLAESNSLKLSPLERLKLLQQLYSPVDYILKAMEKHYVGLSLPFPDKNQKIALLAQSLLQEMIIAHKSIIFDSLYDEKPSKNRLQLATVMQNHMAFNNRLLLCLHLTYSAIPKEFWREQCLILQYAKQLSITDLAVFGNSSPWNVINRFKQAILLTIAPPCSLGQQEILRFNHYLTEWSPHCRLLSMKKYTPGLHTLFIDLHGDEGPKYIENLEWHSHSWRIIDTGALIPAIEGEITKTRDNLASIQLHRETLQRLQKQLGSEKKRQFNRMEKRDAFTLAIGISAIHWMLSHHIGVSNYDVVRPACYMNAFITNVGHSDAPDVWNLYRKAEMDNTLGGRNSDKPIEHETYDFDVVDESANGFKLKLKQKQKQAASGLKVGELISLHKGFNGTGKHFGLALIRWLHRTVNNEFMIGVELIAPHALPVEVSLYSENENPNFQHKMRALLLPEQPAIKQPTALIMPNTFKENQQVLLQNGNGQEDELIILKQQNNQGSSYAQYQYERIERKTQHAPKTPFNTQRNDDILDNNWELL